MSTSNCLKWYQVLSIGGGHLVAFWSFVFLHVLRIRNTLPDIGQGSSPIHLSTGKKDNLKNFRTF